MATFSEHRTGCRAQIRLRGIYRSGTFDTRGQAEAWAAREEAKILAGEVKPPLGGPSVADILLRYAREVSPQKRGERWEVIRLAKLSIDPAFAGPILALDGPAMAEWRDRRLREVSAASVNRELDLLSGVLTRAIKEWRIALPSNPVRQIQRPKNPLGRSRRVSDAERAAIMAACGWDGASRPVTIHQWVAFAFSFAMETMMRRGEVLAMTWPNVHGRYVHLPMTKNGTSRDVPLSRAAVALLALLERGTGRVVPIVAGTMDLYFRRVTRKCGLVDLHFHDARHEAITRVAGKLDQMELMRAAGHKDTRTTARYYHPRAEDLADKLG